MTSPPPQPQPSISSARPSPIPAQAGVGLRHPHMAAFASGEATAAWVEIHSENFFAPGGPRIAQLEDVRRRHAVSCHGVGLSLGSARGVDDQHLAALSALIGRIEPGLVSEHLSFSVVEGIYVNDLLPLPYTEEALAAVARNVDHTQNVLGRHILIENPSSYLTFVDSVLSEQEFLAELSHRSGCGLLLDVNNIYVSAENNGFDPVAYLDGIPAEAVQEIHLAGHTTSGDGDERLLIDTHSATVADPVWDLYKEALDRFGPRPTLIEWDADIPGVDVLLAQADIAQSYLDKASGEASRVA